ncbi:hypothetical protein [Halostagnicola sp. A56]|nr:hypothetical protein [Halostagnicola sp. A56]
MTMYTDTDDDKNSTGSNTTSGYLEGALKRAEPRTDVFFHGVAA